MDRGSQALSPEAVISILSQHPGCRLEATLRKKTNTKRILSDGVHTETEPGNSLV